MLAASAEGRIKRARLEPQPDDAVPRFAYEEHLASLTGPDRRWPQSTRRISQLRLTIEFETRLRAGAQGARASRLDLVDYPGEWLLDLPLLDKSYADWSRETLKASETPARAPLSAEWRAALRRSRPAAPRPAKMPRARIAERFHRLSAAGARRRLCAFHPAARPLSDAGRSRGLAGADLRADPARRRRRRSSRARSRR